MKLPTDRLRTLKVRQFMAARVMTFTADTPVSEAVQTLVRNKYTGAPVVDDDGRLIGMLSEKDCLRVVVLAKDYGADGAVVADCMTKDVETVEPDTDLLDVAEGFMQAPFKRFPVVDNGVLVGQISRIDVLRAIVFLLDEGNGSDTKD